MKTAGLAELAVLQRAFDLFVATPSDDTAIVLHAAIRAFQDPSNERAALDAFGGVRRLSGCPECRNRRIVVAEHGGTTACPACTDSADCGRCGGTQKAIVAYGGGIVRMEVCPGLRRAPRMIA